MSRLRLPLTAVGLLSAALFTGCGEAEKPTPDETKCEKGDDECEAEDDGAKADEAPKTPVKNRPDGGGNTPPKGDGGAPSPARDVDAGTKMSPPVSSSDPLPCEIGKIVATHCQSCHGADPSAPMSLVSAKDFRGVSNTMDHKGEKYPELAKKLLNSTGKDRMPPIMPIPDADKQALIAWLDKGAPSGDGKCNAPAPVLGDKNNIDTTGLKCQKFLAHGGGANDTSKFKVGIQRDGYFNFTFVPPWKQTVYGVVARPITDNTKVLHHWLLFQDNVPGVATGAVRSSGAHPGGQLLHGWAPGGEPLNLRRAQAQGADGTVGIELPATTYTVEYHYNSDDPNAEDQSGVEVCWQEEKPKYLAGLSWLGWDQWAIPAQTWEGTCRPTSNQPITILGVSPHMHLAGKHMKAIINRKDGSKETLHDAPFNFEFQVSYDKFVVLQPGDSITTTCEYDQPMAFGESTGAEMCYLFTMAYPKGALASPDLLGSGVHGGSACLGL